MEKIFEKQIYYEQMFSSGFISDRTVMDNLAYCLWYYKDNKYLYPDIMDNCRKLFDTHMRTKPYDMIFFVDEWFTLKDNGIRCMNLIQQMETYHMLHSIVSLYGKVYKIPVNYITGSTEERISEIEKWIDLK